MVYIKPNLAEPLPEAGVLRLEFDTGNVVIDVVCLGEWPPEPGYSTAVGSWNPRFEIRGWFKLGLSRPDMAAQEGTL